jgi:hypothetical protein
MKDITLSYLEDQIDAMGHFPYKEKTVETVGKFLCGENWELAKQPFSYEFLSNVSYSGSNAMHSILWLQINATVK